MSNDAKIYPSCAGAAIKAAFEPVEPVLTKAGLSGILDRVRDSIKPLTVCKPFDCNLGSVTFETLSETLKTTIKPIPVAYRPLEVSLAFQSILETQEKLAKSFWHRNNIAEPQDKTDSKIIIPNNDIIVVDKEIIIPQRKRGNKTGSVQNYADREKTKKYFYWFIKENERKLLDFTREQIRFFVEAKMKLDGCGECFMPSYFYFLYSKCPDVNHNPGNHHGQKNKPEMILLVNNKISTCL